MGKIISAVVCTYNREEHIESCIRSLLAQSLERDLFEIIVVDNASTDNTATILERLNQEHSFRVIYEPESGLSIARNRGWKEATGKYISYLDDDAVADKMWLESACWAFEHLSPIPQCLTGTITLAPEQPLPEWISEDLQVCLGYLNFGEKSLEMHSSSQKIIGANCHFTRSILVKTGGFDENLGRKKTLLLSGEETLLQRTIESIGGATWFHPNVAVTHFVAKERLHPKWFYRRYFWGGVSNIYMSKAKSLQSYSVALCDAVDGEVAESRWKRLLKNTISAFGSASRTSTIHSRVYMSYVAGYLYGFLRSSLLGKIFQ